MSTNNYDKKTIHRKNNFTCFFILAALIIFSLFFLKNKDDVFLKTRSAPAARAEAVQLGAVNNPGGDFLNELPPGLMAEAMLVKNLNSGRYLLDYNSQKRWPLASLTKLITAVVALETDSSLRTKFLVRQMMVFSSNEAALTLAKELGGEEKFIEKMRLKLGTLTMGQTSVFDSSGLSFLNQSTLKDIEKLVDHITRNYPQIWQYSRQSGLKLEDGFYENINFFHNSAEFLGGKTGFTEEARGNLVSIFNFRGQPILIVILGAENKEARFQQAEIILEWMAKYYN